MATDELPAWVRELDMALPVHPQVLLVGNVRDEYLLPAEGGSGDLAPYDLLRVIERVCRGRGFAALVVHDIVHGVARLVPLQPELPRLPPELLELAEHQGGQQGRPTEPDGSWARRVLVAAVGHRGPPVAMVFPFAGRLGAHLTELDDDGKTMFAAAEALGYAALPAPGRDRVTTYNTVFWVAERQEDMPAEFAAGSHTLRTITVPPAPAEQRLAAAKHAVRGMVRGEGLLIGSGEADEAAERLTGTTHGMMNSQVLAIGRLARDRGLPPSRLDDAARLYRTGVVDNPWATETLRRNIQHGEGYLNSVVLGQPDAVRKTIGIFRRSATGLTGAHASSSPNRPRGVLFLLGPTGVGKTELAKGVATLIFGETAEPIRFDMSEFAREHAVDRLIGAPPGYVGHKAGGELTKAVRQNPMSVLLFDEIEKADPRLFDLFLQILEDGRLTDGRGATAYFTDCVLIFTSNLGVVDRTPQGGARPRFTFRDDPAEVRRALEAAYVDFFDNRISRPEIRNRLGNGFVVMDFIQPDNVPAILAKLLRNVVARVAKAHEARLEISDAAADALREAAVANLDHGGRGIGNAVDAALVEPLANELFERPAKAGETITVTDLTHGEQGWRIEVRRCPG